MYYFLHFSDAAKFADIARNLFDGLGYGNKFSFWSQSIFHTVQKSLFLAPWTPPIMPFSIVAFFKIFGVSDFAVIATSMFYFILLLTFTFLLGKKLFKNKFVAVLSTVVLAFNKDIINYAMNGASEMPLMFEIVAAIYFLTLRKKWTTFLSFLLLMISYFTRPQAFIYIAGVILYYLLTRFNLKKALLFFLLILLIGQYVDKHALTIYSGTHFLYSVTSRGSDAINQYSSNVAVSDALRGGPKVSTKDTSDLTSSPLFSLFKKVFYNLYNFYRLMPQIMNPYLFFLFVIGVFRFDKNRQTKSFKIVSMFMFFFTFLVTAAAIPFFRYLHPVVPLVYIIAVETLVWIVGRMVGEKWSANSVSKFKLFRSTYTIHSSQVVALVTTTLIFIFVIGQTLGIIFLDSRFERKTHNVGKPPIYVEMSKVLKVDTSPTDAVVTNLDTWGTWYGDRKTVWFPLEPSQLNKGDGINYFDAIYLTNYLSDDENYRMGEKWKQIFENPENIADDFIKQNYDFYKEYSFSSDTNYERIEGRAVLLKKKEQELKI